MFISQTIVGSQALVVTISEIKRFFFISQYIQKSASVVKGNVALFLAKRTVGLVDSSVMESSNNFFPLFDEFRAIFHFANGVGLVLLVDSVLAGGHVLRGPVDDVLHGGLECLAKGVRAGRGLSWGLGWGPC